MFWRRSQLYGPGAKDAEIKSGTLPYSGPGSACGIIGTMELENFDRTVRKPFGGSIWRPETDATSANIKGGNS
jgi:hypothetical protein